VAAVNPDLAEAAKTIESLTGVLPAFPVKRTRKEKQELAARIKRFLALSPQLQEGCLKYAENIMQGYRK
jgi:hypothetical protein